MKMDLTADNTCFLQDNKYFFQGNPSFQLAAMVQKIIMINSSKILTHCSSRFFVVGESNLITDQTNVKNME